MRRASNSEMSDRTEVAKAAAASLRGSADRLAASRALVGFDGFIDTILDVVDRRESPERYRRVGTIEQFARFAAAASGRSANAELVEREVRYGGNGPLLASGLSGLGLAVTYIGAVGDPLDNGRVHRLFEPFAARCSRVLPVAEPARTEALEFDDGKIMLGRSEALARVGWGTIVDRVGEAVLREVLRTSSLIGLVNWVMMPRTEEMWEGLAAILTGLGPEAGGAPPRRIIVDLADPARRSDDDLVRAMDRLRALDSIAPVTLGLNLAEGERLAGVMGVAAGPGRLEERVPELTRTLRAALRLTCVVVHPREGAGASDGTSTAWFEGPFTPCPRLSTGAGDHFNAGFAAGAVAGLPLEQALACGCAASGAYVRDAATPSLGRICALLEDLPAPGTD